MNRFITLSLFSLLSLFINISKAEEIPTASSNGRYEGLVQELSCPRDNAKYGYFYDYGYWEGGDWCDQKGKKGYWVYLDSTWYVWARKTTN